MAASVPGVKTLNDAGYAYAPGTVVVRCVPGGPFPPGHVHHAYNRDLAKIREPVEWGFMHVSMGFPYLNKKNAMKTNTPVSAMYKGACLLHNCFLCLGYGIR
jgi:hypothetical protein